MKQQTLQEQYNLIKEGKGHQGKFIADAKRQFPNIIHNSSNYESTIQRLKQYHIISEPTILTEGKEINFFKSFNSKVLKESFDIHSQVYPSPIEENIEKIKDMILDGYSPEDIIDLVLGGDDQYLDIIFKISNQLWQEDKINNDEDDYHPPLEWNDDEFDPAGGRGLSSHLEEGKKEFLDFFRVEKKDRSKFDRYKFDGSDDIDSLEQDLKGYASGREGIEGYYNIASKPDNIDESTDVNDPVLMKARASKDAFKRGDYDDDRPKYKKGFRVEKSDPKGELIKALQADREQLLRDMEQEAEPEGGSVADEYGAALNKIDKKIASLSEGRIKESKPSKEIVDMETRAFDFKDLDNVDNVFGEEFLKGLQVEMDDPKNEEKTLSELKKIVAKNLAKDRLFYVKDGAFGIKGIGYVDNAPGLAASKSDQMEKVKLKESKRSLREMRDVSDEAYDDDEVTNDKIVSMLRKSIEDDSTVKDQRAKERRNANVFVRENNDDGLEQAKAEAQRISKEEGVAQHVNKVGNRYRVEDWYDSDTTVASYENGEQCEQSARNDQSFREFGMDFDQLGPNEQDWVMDKIQNMSYSHNTDGNPKDTEMPSWMRENKMGETQNFDKWRRVYNGKAIASLTTYIKDSLGNKKRYVIYFKYAESPSSDDIYLTNSLIGGWEGGGIPHSLSSLQNRGDIIDKYSRIMFKDPEEFNHIISTLPDSLEEILSQIWDGDQIESRIIRWMRTGVYKLESISPIQLVGSNLNENKIKKISLLDLLENSLPLGKKPKPKKKKEKKETTDSKLAEIDKQGRIVTLESQIETLEQIIDSKNQRISLVAEDENLSELVDSKKIKEMQKEIKLLEKKKGGLEKLYEKLAGCAYEKKEIVDENEDNLDLE